MDTDDSPTDFIAENMADAAVAAIVERVIFSRGGVVYVVFFYATGRRVCAGWAPSREPWGQSVGRLPYKLLQKPAGTKEGALTLTLINGVCCKLTTRTSYVRAVSQRGHPPVVRQSIKYAYYCVPPD